MAHQPATHPLDNVDPHHELGGHAGHVIVRPSTLVAVLAALLVFTVMTVAASRAEVWAAEKFDVVIPNIINVAVALSIATVKAVLVALFFMQLKYDNPLNSIIFLFCLFAFALFLFFSMTDLHTRGIIYSFKAGEIQVGGTGINSAVTDAEGNIRRGVNTGTMGIVEFARQRRIDQIGEMAQQGVIDLQGRTAQEVFWEQFEVFNHSHRPRSRPAVSNANFTVPRQGQTPGLFTPESAAAAGEKHGH